jgi:hypothetical protein
MLRCRFAFLFGALLALLATAMAAQTSVANWDTVRALTNGTQVRITADSRTVRGKIDRITDDALMVTSGKGPETFDRQQVSVVSVEKSGHRKRNALIGLAVGTGVGLGIGIAARSKPNQLEIIPNSAVTAGFTVAGAVVGTIVGVVIPSGGWREIYRK